MQNEIVLPETRPETEWVRGRALQKVSPTRKHALVQSHLASALIAWAKGRGEVGTEWRFRVTPAGELRRPVVPDIAFVRFEQMRAFDEAELDAPTFAPHLAVEILSPGDDPRDVADKTTVYLRSGTRVVAIVDPVKRSFVTYDLDAVATFAGHDEMMHPELPGFSLAVAPFFDEALGATPDDRRT